MPVTLVELADSRQVSVTTEDAKITLRFLALGSMNEGDILAATFAQTPPVYQGLIRTEVNIEPFEKTDGVWQVTVTYKPTSRSGTDTPVGENPSPPSGGGGSGQLVGPSFSVDLVGDTVKITQSIRTTGNVAPGGVLFGVNLRVVGPNTVLPDAIVNPAMVGATIFVVGGPRQWRYGGYMITAVDVNNNTLTLDAMPAPVGTNNGVWQMPTPGPNYRRAIGVTENSVEGCDVYVPRFEWSVTYQANVITWDYLMTVWRLVGCKNKDKFYGANPGEVLYLGMNGSYSVSDRWSITHKFSVIPNELNVKVSDEITIPIKRGWDYLWVRYKRIVESNTVMHVPAVAYTEEVIPDGDFALLGIGS